MDDYLSACAVRTVSETECSGSRAEVSRIFVSLGGATKAETTTGATRREPTARWLSCTIWIWAKEAAITTMTSGYRHIL